MLTDIVKGIKKTIEDNIFEKEQKCVVFIGSTFQANFFFVWRELVEKKHKIKFELSRQDDESNQMFFNHSWLPKKNIFWLGEVTKLENIPQSTKNHLAFFCSEQKFEQLNFALKNFDLLTIKFPKTISQSQLPEFMDLVGCKLSENRLAKLKNVISSLETSICPDKLIELGHYFQLSSAIFIEKTECYVSEILPTEQKFFQLPDLLFSGNWPAFFKLWDQTKSTFPSQFWIAFWTNAFFKACFIKNNAKIKTSLFSKSLIKSQNSNFFKELSLIKLKSTLHKIYKIDHDFKSGYGSGELEPIFFSLLNKSANPLTN